MAWIRALVRIIFIAIAFFSAGLSYAHSNTGALILVRVMPDTLEFDLEIPLSNLRHELNKPLEKKFLDFPSPVVDAYVAKHFSVKLLNGKNLPLNFKSTEIFQREGTDWQRVAITTLPDAVSGEREFILDSDVIIHNRTDKHTQIFLMTDFVKGNLNHPSFVAEFSPEHHVWHFRGEAGSWLGGFWASVTLGIGHISEGLDHLLFLFILLITVCYRHAYGSNGKLNQIQLRLAIINAVVLVSAFSFGHFISLVIGVLEIFSLNETVVESAIALTVLMSAIHAMKPFKRAHELKLALVFGIIHGLGFASGLSEFHLSGKALGFAVLGFNLGIEWVQVALLISAVPLFLVFFQFKYSMYCKNGLGLIAFILGSIWFWERSTHSLIIPEFALGNAVWWVVGICGLVSLVSVVTVMFKNKAFLDRTARKKDQATNIS